MTTTDPVYVKTYSQPRGNESLSVEHALMDIRISTNFAARLLDARGTENNHDERSRIARQIKNEERFIRQ